RSQVSTINSQFPILNFQFSIFNFQFAIAPLLLPPLPVWNSFGPIRLCVARGLRFSFRRLASRELRNGIPDDRSRYRSAVPFGQLDDSADNSSAHTKRSRLS